MVFHHRNKKRAGMKFSLLFLYIGGNSKLSTAKLQNKIS